MHTVCASVLDGSDPNCIPYNPFQIGGVTPEALNYLQVPGLQQGKIEQEVYSAAVTGDLGAYGIQSPLASESIKVAFGAEKRFDRLRNVTDDPTASFLLSGTGGPTIGLSGSTKVFDLFTEFRVPLVQDRPFADQLGMELAYRRSDYDPVTTDTYKIGLDWAPVQDVRFRAQLSARDSRAECRGAVHGAGLQPVRPAGRPVRCGPRSGRQAQRRTQACLAYGRRGPLRAPGLDSPAGQYNFLQGGNLELQPESRTRTPTV